MCKAGWGHAGRRGDCLRLAWPVQKRGRGAPRPQGVCSGVDTQGLPEACLWAQHGPSGQRLGTACAVPQQRPAELAWLPIATGPPHRGLVRAPPGPLPLLLSMPSRGLRPSFRCKQTDYQPEKASQPPLPAYPRALAACQRRHPAAPPPGRRPCPRPRPRPPPANPARCTRVPPPAAAGAGAWPCSSSCLRRCACWGGGCVGVQGRWAVEGEGRDSGWAAAAACEGTSASVIQA